MKHIDANGKEIKAGDIVDMHQTINGQNLFLIINPVEKIISFINSNILLGVKVK